MTNYKSGEIQATQYYIHNSYVNTYYHAYKFVEEWVSKNIFRNDPSRVFLASDGYAFRRRFELTDSSVDYNTIEFSSLNLPFANYWPQNNNWKPDDRVASKQAALTYIGIYVGNTKVRASQVTIDIPVTFWFDREDDARLAYDVLHFNSYNEHYYSSNVPYGRDNTVDDTKGSSSLSLSLPFNLRISNLQFNPEFKETDWLKKQRVFTVKTTFVVRSYSILPPSQPDYNASISGTDYDDGITYYSIVDDAVLNFGNKNWVAQTYDAGFNEVDQSYKGTTKFPDKGLHNTVYVDSHIDDNTLPSVNPKIYIWDEYNEKYISPEYEIDFKSYRYSEAYTDNTLDIVRFDCNCKVTFTTNTIEWVYGSNLSCTDIKDITLMISGRSEPILIDPIKSYNEETNISSYKLSGLAANSKYYGYVAFTSKDGISKKFMVNFVTKTKKEDIKAPSNSLVGITW